MCEIATNIALDVLKLESESIWTVKQLGLSTGAEQHQQQIKMFSSI
jgi:hypothetical protein